MKELKGMKVKLKEPIGGETIINADEYIIYEGAVEMEGAKGHWIVDMEGGNGLEGKRM